MPKRTESRVSKCHLSWHFNTVITSPKSQWHQTGSILHLSSLKITCMSSSYWQTLLLRTFRGQGREWPWSPRDADLLKSQAGPEGHRERLLLHVMGLSSPSPWGHTPLAGLAGSCWTSRWPLSPGPSRSRTPCHWSGPGWRWEGGWFPGAEAANTEAGYLSILQQMASYHCN